MKGDDPTKGLSRQTVGRLRVRWLRKKMWERFTVKKRCTKNFLEEATKAVQLERKGKQNESPCKEELERLRVGSDMRLDGTLMLHEISAGKAGDWADLLKSDRLNAWTSAKLRECYSGVEQEDQERKSVVQKILQKSQSKDREGSPCRTCALIVTDVHLKTATGGVHRNTGTSSATGGTRRAMATTTGGTRTES